MATHRAYPSRALGLGWRVSYKRKARHLLVALGALLLLWVMASWLIITWISAGILTA